MKLLKKMGLTGLRNASACLALTATFALPAQAIASATVVAASATVASASLASPVDAPKGILASGQIHKRTTPAISLANEPELPFFLKSWVFALLTVLIVVAIKRPWNSSSKQSVERRASRSAGLIAPLARS